MWVGLLALEVTTNTPDALCPPLEEAKAAILARVGEVRGPYHVEYALIRRDRDQVLDLVLRDGSQTLLHRELPLDGAGCQDAAQAMALVLERYFEAVEKPATREPASSLAPIPVSASLQVGVAPADFPTLPPPSPAPSPWRARGGLLYDLELGFAPLLGAALFSQPLLSLRGLQVGVSLDIAPFLGSITQTVRDVEISASTLQGAITLPVIARVDTWSAWIGPWAHLRVQRAEGTALERGQTAYRALPGLGAFAQLSWSQARSSWTLGLGVAGGAQLTEASARFVLVDSEGRTNQVLVPERHFGQAQLGFTLQL